MAVTCNMVVPRGEALRYFLLIECPGTRASSRYDEQRISHRSVHTGMDRHCHRLSLAPGVGGWGDYISIKELFSYKSCLELQI